MAELIPYNWGYGWFPLTAAGIAENVEEGEWGCYILARQHGSIIIETRSGRSTNLYSRLNDHRRKGYYQYFRVGGSEEDMVELYEMECERYHNLAGVIASRHGEKIHPARPEGMSISCPICGR
jgi:hypothetical protein